jgi:hypothetical protein
LHKEDGQVVVGYIPKYDIAGHISSSTAALLWRLEDVFATVPQTSPQEERPGSPPEKQLEFLQGFLLY